MQFGEEPFGLNIFGGSIGAVGPVLPGEYECVSIADATDNNSTDGMLGCDTVSATDKFSTISVCKERI